MRFRQSKASHLGLLLASGHLDGGEGENRHAARRKVEKLTHTYQQYQGDSLVEREVERYQISIKVLSRQTAQYVASHLPPTRKAPRGSPTGVVPQRASELNSLQAPQDRT